MTRGEKLEFEEVVKQRRSIRSYTGEEIGKDEIYELLKIGHAAPSAGNLQARDFIIVNSHETKTRLKKAAYGQKFIEDSSWVIVVCANEERSAKRYGDRGRELYSVQDASAAVENILLAVTDKGLGAVWVGAFDEEWVANILDIPDGVRPVAMIPIGHPDKISKEPPKMDVEELTHEGSW